MECSGYLNLGAKGVLEKQNKESEQPAEFGGMPGLCAHEFSKLAICECVIRTCNI